MTKNVYIYLWICNIQLILIKFPICNISSLTFHRKFLEIYPEIFRPFATLHNTVIQCFPYEDCGRKPVNKKENIQVWLTLESTCRFAHQSQVERKHPMEACRTPARSCKEVWELELVKVHITWPPPLLFLFASLCLTYIQEDSGCGLYLQAVWALACCYAGDTEQVIRWAAAESWWFHQVSVFCFLLEPRVQMYRKTHTTD